MTSIQPVVPSAKFQSSACPASERRGQYCAHMSGSWQAELLGDDHHAMEATVWNLGEMVVTANDFPPRRVARTASMARADQLDHYYVHLPLAADGLRLEADDDGDEINVAAGEPVLMDLSRPFDTVQGAGRSIQAFMPREVLEEMLPGPRDLHAARLQGAAASILADLLQSLMNRLPGMATSEASSVAKGTMHLVAASLAPTPDTLERARPAIESSLLRQACRFIEMHLKEADLGTPQICAALKISRATLYRLFEAYGGVSNHIKERRLIRIHGVICAPGQNRSLALIAEEHGFNSAAQFSRAFRQQFGYCPSEAASVAQTLTASPQASAELPYGESLAAWLRPLRG
jgi:AraC-like DNA-binding protein